MGDRVSQALGFNKPGLDQNISSTPAGAFDHAVGLGSPALDQLVFAAP
jgi:hypothetical protein